MKTASSFFAVVVLFSSAPWVAADDPDKVVKVGIVETLFRDITKETTDSSIELLKDLMQDQTGKNGQLLTIKNAQELGQQLANGQLDLGVCHGFEFAWARQKYPKLTPLVIAINQTPYLQAHLVVQRDVPVRSFAELKNKALAMPARSREHCWLYVERNCQQTGSSADTFFSKVTKPSNTEDALEDAVDKIVDATVVDSIELKRFKIRKPARFEQLKEIGASAVFPATVVIYMPGKLPESTLELFRNGLLNATMTTKGQKVMTVWRMTDFQSVPRDYDRTVDEIGKAYPPPAQNTK